MDPLKVIVFGLATVLAVLAVVVSIQHREHRWLAAYLSWGAVADWVHFLLGKWLDHQARPYTGTARFILHLAHLIWLLTSSFGVAACMHYFARRRPIVPLVVSLGFWLVLVVGYPSLSGARSVSLFRAHELLMFVGMWAAILWGMARVRDARPQLAHLVLMLEAGYLMVVNIVPYSRGMLTHWNLVLVAAVLHLLVSCGAHVWWLWRARLRTAPTR